MLYRISPSYLNTFHCGRKAWILINQHSYLKVADQLTAPWEPPSPVYHGMLMTSCDPIFIQPILGCIGASRMVRFSFVVCVTVYVLDGCMFLYDWRDRIGGSSSQVTRRFWKRPMLFSRVFVALSFFLGLLRPCAGNYPFQDNAHV